MGLLMAGQTKEGNRTDVCPWLFQSAYLGFSLQFHSCSQITPALPTEGPNHHLTLVKGLRGGIWHPDPYLLAKKHSYETPVERMTPSMALLCSALSLPVQTGRARAKHAL